jgi:hypothetical protein
VSARVASPEEILAFGFPAEPSAVDEARLHWWFRGGSDAENGHYARLASAWERTFLILPLGHSEDLESRELAVRLSAELAANASPAMRPLLEHSAAQARAYRDVIARFGRHPHRNEALCRASTPAERAYLASETPPHRREIALEPRP